MMDEAWEKAVDVARGGEEPDAVRSLTLDGAVKCSQGRLPASSLLEQFSQLRVLSIANVGLASLTDFPSLPHLERLILSDNRISGGLDSLVDAGLVSLRDLDLSNNKIQTLEDLSPLAKLRLLSLDLYECPVTRIHDYRPKVFSLIRSLQYLDKLDAKDNERPESDDEEDEEEEDEDEDEDDVEDGLDLDEDDSFPHSKEASGLTVSAVGTAEDEDDLPDDDDNDEDEDESDEVDEDDEGVQYNGVANHVETIDVEDSGSDEDEDEDEEEDEDEDDDDDGDAVEVHDIEETEEEEEEVGDDDEDGVEVQEEDLDEDDDDDDDDGTDPGLSGDLEPQVEYENGDIGEGDDESDEIVENRTEEDDEDEGNYENFYQVDDNVDEGVSDLEPGEDDNNEDSEDDVDEYVNNAATADPATLKKRKRAKDDDHESDDSNDTSDDDDEDDDDDERPPKH